MKLHKASLEPDVLAARKLSVICAAIGIGWAHHQTEVRSSNTTGLWIEVMDDPA